MYQRNCSIGEVGFRHGPAEGIQDAICSCASHGRRNSVQTHQYTRRLIQHQALSVLSFPGDLERWRRKSRRIAVCVMRSLVIFDREYSIYAILRLIANVLVGCSCSFEDETNEFTSPRNSRPVKELVRWLSACLLVGRHCGYVSWGSEELQGVCELGVRINAVRAELVRSRFTKHDLMLATQLLHLRSRCLG